MIFLSDFHTKDYLLNHHGTLRNLAKNSSEFAQSELAQDFDLLSIRVNISESNPEVKNTIAHLLAQYQPSWLLGQAHQNKDILKLRGFGGNTVAHKLAECQIGWYDFEASKDLEILLLRSDDDFTVMHDAAFKNCEHIHEIAKVNPSILFVTSSRWSNIATILASDVVSLEYDHMLKKEVLCCESLTRGKNIAEFLIGKYQSKSNDGKWDIPTIASVLLSQGAAYKHSEALPLKDIREIFEKGHLLLSDATDNKVKLMIAIATYSTIFHSTEQAKEPSGELLEMLDLCRLSIEDMIKSSNELLNLEISEDFHCKPGANLYSQLVAKLQLSRVEKTSASDLENSDWTPKQSLY